MSHNNSSNPNVRSLRPRQSVPGTLPQDPPEDTGTVDNEKKGKRGSKKRQLSALDDLHSTGDTDNPKRSLRNVGLRWGDKASRDELLGLLDQNVIRKQTRLNGKPSKTHAKPKPKKKTYPSSNSTNSKLQAGLVESGNSSGVNANKFTCYETQQLVDMLREVGLDMDGEDREFLIQNCKHYEDLLLSPSILPNTQDTAADSLHDEPDIREKSQFMFGVSDAQDNVPSDTSNRFATFTPRLPRFEHGTSSDLPKQSTSRLPLFQHGTPTDVAVSSTSNLPSVERGTLNFPRPRPTNLSSDRLSQSRKGKEKAIEESGSDWNPDYDEGMATDQDEVMCDAKITHLNKSKPIPDEPPTNTTGKRKSTPYNPTFFQGEADGENYDEDIIEPEVQASNAHPTPDGSFDLRSIVDKNTQDITHLTKDLAKANEKIEWLSKELKELTDFVKKKAQEDTESRGKKRKTRGGRTSVQIRFHVETLFGQKLDEIPPPATSSEKTSWNYETDINSIQIDPTFDGDEDADGPGNPDASPQQLSIMCQMLKAAGISSFRPDLGKSATSPENRWLWDIAFKIFLKLVEVGEYTGISLDAENLKYIRTCFDTHIQSLMKRYRQSSWSSERKTSIADRTRRSSRRDTLISLRSKILVQEEVFGLLGIVQTTCSDDETDPESDFTTIAKRNKLPCLVRHMAWRSSELEEIWMLVDQLKEKFDKSLPGLSSTNGSPGRARRPRLRGRNHPSSSIKPPEGLSKDCFQQSWLDELSAIEKLSLEINPVSTLPVIKSKLESLLVKP